MPRSCLPSWHVPVTLTPFCVAPMCCPMVPPPNSLSVSFFTLFPSLSFPSSPVDLLRSILGLLPICPVQISPQPCDPSPQQLSPTAAHIGSKGWSRAHSLTAPTRRLRVRSRTCHILESPDPLNDAPAPRLPCPQNTVHPSPGLPSQQEHTQFPLPRSHHISSRSSPLS